ncbi:DUF676-domain-containing protein [Cutaneotrichosporon oleaginosum]|uniref:DUF676-domain-containing protein n=1 Tax=Cutaneotrichosporon oleaginosum TaxID=879819 RepID=A0A0J1B417_9TREE|nr:DUF676-domain-containing protein [Cutaneotrichosporon oleaginosum]KLT42384.1 DUF676-domain-containing protein [Cutaneotrichosporon oleaginosum]TXT04203.1 hypothetical protein COLE_07900 [Cutaneotrichosporon oleaginosum]
MHDPPSPVPKDVHFVLLLHGLYGSAANLWCLEEEIERAHDSSDCALDLHILNAREYGGALTWDGIDVNAHRVANEVDKEIEALERDGRRVAVFSITGYSLGGLIARALVGELNARSPSFFSLHRPASFCTIATPHLGVLRYGSWRSTWVHAIGQRLFSRTGQQLFCLDNDLGRPLLAQMADPNDKYLRALNVFPRIVIIANAVNDLTVPYATAAICTHDPFIDHVRDCLCVELEGKTVTRYYTADPEEEELELEVAPSPLPSPPVPMARGTERPLLPPVFYTNWNGPLRYALFPFIPLLIPTVLTFVAVTFAFHSFKSAQRIREHSERRRALLADAEDTDTATPGDTPLNSRPLSPVQLSDVEGASTPPFAKGPSNPSQPIISPLQKEMVRAFNDLPQLERITAWFPGVFNAHAVIIARNARNPRWAWQAEGREVVQTWARKVIAAVTEALEAPLPVAGA